MDTCQNYDDPAPQRVSGDSNLCRIFRVENRWKSRRLTQRIARVGWTYGDRPQRLAVLCSKFHRLRVTSPFRWYPVSFAESTTTEGTRQPMNITTQTLENLFDNPTLQALNAFAKRRDVQLYLVGGSVRDWLLGRQTTDIDFTLASDAIQFAKAFAANIGAICIALEENPPTARVIVKPNGISHTPQLSMDFAQFRAASLTEDLRLRDLTINAMAIAFENARTFTNKARNQNLFRVIDPCGGMKDLEIGLLRFPSKQVVIADPVRLLRIYRFAAQLDFEISQNAINLVTEYRSMLSNVAAERCRDELMKIFNVKKARPYLQQMEASGLLIQVVPTLKETCGTWRPLETFEDNPMPTALHAYHTEINDYLREEFSVGINRHSLIKLSLLLGDNLGDIGERLRFSRKSGAVYGASHFRAQDI